jgi:cytochrome c oxidase subunit 3
MPAIITHKPGKTKKRRKDPAFGGLPPVLRRPTGGSDDGGGDDNWDEGHGGPRELLLRVRSFVFSALTVDVLFFAILVAIFFARQTGTEIDPGTHEQIGDWHPVPVPPILYLNTAVLLLSCITMEFARRNIFREIDVLEEWLGLGRPAFRRALPWLVATLTLGALFLAGQWTAWSRLVARGFALHQSPTPASYFFYLITGIHAAHLVIVLAALVFCLSALGWLKRIEYRQIAVDATAWCWHAMGLVWLPLLAVLALGQ